MCDASDFAIGMVLGQLGLGGPHHGSVFGTLFGPNLNSVSVSVTVYLGHNSVRS